MNDFDDEKNMAPALVASHADINELVDKTRIAVDRTARAYGRF